MATSSSRKKTSAESTSKNSLVNNINKRRKSGISRSKEDSTISEKAYKKMEKRWSK